MGSKQRLLSGLRRSRQCQKRGDPGSHPPTTTGPSVEDPGPHQLRGVRTTRLLPRPSGPGPSTGVHVFSRKGGVHTWKLDNFGLILRPQCRQGRNFREDGVDGIGWDRPGDPRTIPDSTRVHPTFDPTNYSRSGKRPSPSLSPAPPGILGERDSVFPNTQTQETLRPRSLLNLQVL